jgi:hypothetical protein
MSSVESQRQYLNTLEIQRHYIKEMRKIKELLRKKIVPDVYPDAISIPLWSDGMLSYDRSGLVDRDEFVHLSSFALVANSWIKPLSSFLSGKKCLEIMAGRGMLARALNDCGVDIIATDDFSWKWKIGITQTRTLCREDLWFDVENADCLTAVEKYCASVDYIICCWPYMNNKMYLSLLKMREINPDCKLIYIGEGIYGCTADDDFHEAAQFLDGGDLFNEARRNFQRWHMINDSLQLMN